ncbi:S8 family peptidase [Arcicella aquatica]|uniref:S8 family peptidase n=1 Tax=Arcicella aquatica TaxID=217141 RepID=A0ABU5QQW4_9BACT|nr:S8 family peptidase [Arcicella aquatica]MEA5259478.1 S8 family peptidase [Arcicella aquatica]
MQKSPIQVVVNSHDFVDFWERQGGGSKKDFYENRDDEFINHKNKLIKQLSLLNEKKTDFDFSDVQFVKLRLKQSALAKSHRPTKIFSNDIAPIVGGGDLGELYIELTPNSIGKITEKIRSAENETRWKINKDGKTEANPTSIRSAVGSIDDISSYSKSDKRKFSVTEGIEWISKPQTGGAYIIELFEILPPRNQWDILPEYKFRLFKSFIEGLTQIGNGLVATTIAGIGNKDAIMGIRLEESSSKPNIQISPTSSSAKKESLIKQIVLDENKHYALLNFLDKHPLVKKILLPPVISKNESKSDSNSNIVEEYSQPQKNSLNSYPKVCIVDGGVSDLLNNWIIERWGLLSKSDKDEEHGTFIGGLLLSGQSLNGKQICKEIDGCNIIDLDLLPIPSSFENYYSQPLQFFRELELAVKDLKEKTGVRVFNFSLNIEEHVTSEGYSSAAKMLDKISEENDVIFIISAGNTDPNDFRKEWPNDPIDALSILAASKNDIIKTPAESSRNLSVAALNPPNLKGVVPFAPSNYTCRGPGIRVGLKPDLAHIGGAGSSTNTGLKSLDSNGKIIEGCGTSYAAPNVAKVLASLDHTIEGQVSRETLIGMSIHSATLPDVLNDSKFSEVAKFLVGFGIPSSSEEILNGSENEITLVFATRLIHGKKMTFDFSWPPSLVKNGKCIGKARLTIVSTPPFDYRYGAEFVRVNIDGHLRQLQNNGGYKGRLDPIYIPNHSVESILTEKNQISHSFKWSPVKVYEKEFVKGVGPSINWRLEVDYLEREGERIPPIGIPFTAILTISDSSKSKPIFNEMRQSLQSLGVKILDIKTAARVSARI